MEADKDAIMKLIDQRTERKAYGGEQKYSSKRKQEKKMRGRIKGTDNFLRYMNAQLDGYGSHKITKTGFYKTALEVINEGLKTRYYGKKRTWEKDHLEA